MQNKKIKDMVIYALFIALIGVASFTPIGFVPLVGVSITTLHVFVLIMAFLTGKKGGLVAGLAFGIFSLIRALVMPNAITDLIFINPIVSVLPRAIFGFLAGLTSDILNKKYGNQLVKKTLLIAISAVILTFIHTAMVLPLMYLFAPLVDGLENFWQENAFLTMFGAVMVANGFLEMIFAGVITPLCVVPLAKVMERS